MKQYVLGFAFSRNKKDLVLIEKQKPDWQKGLFNGIGGKIEVEDGSPLNAMYREFEEETGAKVFLGDDFNSWNHFATMQGKDWVCYCFKTFSNVIYQCKTMEDEEVVLMPVDTALLKKNKIENLNWLIHLALDENPTFTEINY